MTIPARIPGRERWEIEDKLILSNATDKTGELTIYGGTAGEKAVEILSGSTSIFQILATSTTVRLLGGANTPIQIGDAGANSHNLAANDDLFVSGKCEIDGITYFDGAAVHYNTVTLSANYELILGAEADTFLDFSTVQTQASTLIWGLDDVAKTIIFCDAADRAKNFDHAGQTNPTIFIHSNKNPDTANDEWISITHDVTDGVIAVGSGTLNLGGSTVNFVNTTRTASTVTHDAYATLEIGGTEYKFMLGS